MIQVGVWFGLLAVECEAAGNSSSKSELMVLNQKKVVCPVQVSEETLPQVEELKYLGVLLTSEVKIERKIDRRISVSSAVMQSMYRSVVLKKDLKSRHCEGSHSSR